MFESWGAEINRSKRPQVEISFYSALERYTKLGIPRFILTFNRLNFLSNLDLHSLDGVTIGQRGRHSEQSVESRRVDESGVDAGLHAECHVWLARSAVFFCFLRGFSVVREFYFY